MTDDRDGEQPAVLTIAGFDPSGGAGIIADVKTFQAFGCRPLAAVTSLTFQNSRGVFGAIHQSAESLRAQVLPIIEEVRIAAVKIGMLPTSEIVLAVVRLVREQNLPAPVVDPVLRSSSGDGLMAEAAIEIMLSELTSLSRVITPNIPEAETLTGLKITNEDEMCEAAGKLREMGARAVLVKGGHLIERSDDLVPDTKRQAIDVLDDRGQITVFRGEWIDSPPVRGTGCMLSSAIAACLAQRMPLGESVRAAKQFVADAIRYAPKLGPDPVTLELTEMTKLED
ncbi:MAG: bifunctional hydroxymethylpyrimidine kinase/phosphomethylpyrimidine kinase [Acidobacteria bacterium]|nr:MAG: bifunctional hydroxymethylpyrimidine kinase/phosphomethylpyrimidine kinase [Acidobacteriota bacterium]